MWKKAQIRIGESIARNGSPFLRLIKWDIASQVPRIGGK